MSKLTNLEIAAQCWCDEETKTITMNSDLAQAFAKRLDDKDKKTLELQDFCIWLTGCGYDFCQHDYFIEQRDKLLLDHNLNGSESSEVELLKNK